MCLCAVLSLILHCSDRAKIRSDLRIEILSYAAISSAVLISVGAQVGYYIYYVYVFGSVCCPKPAWSYICRDRAKIRSDLRVETIICSYNS
jgi:tetrahydromethanopterin S-methyltransferase subunit D